MNIPIHHRVLTLALALGLATVSSAEKDGKNLDLEGVWNVKSTTDDGAREYTWTFKKDGEKLTGSSASKESGTERSFDRIKVDGKTVTVEIDFERDGNKGILKVVAEQQKEGGKLAGKWSVEDSEGTEFLSGDITVEKEIKIAFAGDWKAAATLTNGGTLTSNLKLEGKGEKLKGHFERQNGGTTEIDEIKVDGRSLRLAFDLERDSNTIDVVVEASLVEEHKLSGLWIVKDSDGNEGPKGDWVAVRETKIDLAGNWLVSAQLPDGGEYSGTLELERISDGYKGTSASDRGKRELKTVVIDGKSLHYTVEMEREGETQTITVKAALAEDGKLTGTWSLAKSDGTKVAGDQWLATRKADASKTSQPSELDRPGSERKTE